MTETITVDAAWLKEAASKLGGESTVLVQGFPYTGFGTLRENGELAIPAKFGPPDLEHSWDLRIFRDNCEIHTWRIGPEGWRWRQAKQADWQYKIERYQVLWGTSVEEADNDWRLLTELRGSKVWLPPAVKLAGPELALRIIERVTQESETGMAGIVDAMIAGIEEAGALKFKKGVGRYAE